MANHLFIGLQMGIPQVGISHTISVMAWVQYLWAMGTVLHETCGTSDTHGFSSHILNKKDTR